MISIEFDKFTLPNGLDVILSRDNSLPVASVNLWYHVGSKNEDEGKTGFAHLFEHVMFEGSKNPRLQLLRAAHESRGQPERLHDARPHQLLG